MSRGKPVTRKLTTEKQPQHSDPRQMVAALNKTVEVLTKTLHDYQVGEDERAEIQRQYIAAQEKLEEESSLPSTEKSREKIQVTWLDNNNHECRRAKVVIPEGWSEPIIFVKGDEQLGHVTCDETRIKKDIDWVEKNPQCLVMLLGDAIDSATKESPGSIRENKVGPIQQATRYIEMHRPIQDRIIGYVGGNHERRIDKALSEGGAGVRLIAEGLSTPDYKIPYSGALLLLDLHWRGHLWTFTLFHGAGAASTPGSITQRLQKNIHLTDSLITLSGHLHSEMKTSRRFIKRGGDGKVKVAKQTSLQCGTYLQYIGSYGEVGGMNPTGPDMIVIELKSDGRYIDRFKGDSDN
jgi:hypothetical protein